MRGKRVQNPWTGIYRPLPRRQANQHRHLTGTGDKIRVSSSPFVVSLGGMREFLEFVIRELIEFPDDIVLTEIPNGRMITFKLQLRRGDVGRVIGRSGQTIHAIRALLASSAARHGQRAVLEIVE